MMTEQNFDREIREHEVSRLVLAACKRMGTNWVRRILMKECQGVSYLPDMTPAQLDAAEAAIIAETERMDAHVERVRQQAGKNREIRTWNDAVDKKRRDKLAARKERTEFK